MNNLKSYTEYAVSTPTTDFVIGFDFNYGTDAVNVTVDGVPATEAGYSVIYLNSTTMRLSPAVPTGVVRLQRETDIDVPDNSFTAGAKFIASNMDENFTQLRHAQQEVRDGFGKLSEDTYEIIDTLQVVGQAAQDAADAAEQAAELANDAAAQVSDKVPKSATLPTYLTVADGVDPVTGVADGAYFNVRSSGDESYGDEYQNVGGSAVATGKSYPSKMVVDVLNDSLSIVQRKVVRETVSVFDFFSESDYAAYIASPTSFDAKTQLQEFFDYIKANKHSKADVSGEFYISSGVVVGDNSSTTLATKTIQGNLKLTALNAIDIILDFKSGQDVVWFGNIQADGIGSHTSSTDTRNCRIGIYYRNNCNRLTIMGVSTANKCFENGVIAGNKTIGLLLKGGVQCFDCGTGHYGNSRNIRNIISKTNSGSAGGLAQKTTIVVNSIPDFVTTANSTVSVLIGSQLYMVDAITGNSIDVFPWVDSSDTGNELRFVLGGAFRTESSDNASFEVAKLVAQRCASVADLAGLYGGIFNNVIAEYNLQGVIFGGSRTAGLVGGQFNELYIENTMFNIVRRTNYTLNTTFIAPIGLTLDSVCYQNAARSSNNELTTSFATLKGCTFIVRGQVLNFEKNANNGESANSSHIFDIFEGKNISRSFRKTAVSTTTVNLTAPNSNLQHFGYDSGVIRFSGGGGNGQYGGTVNFVAPEGYTMVGTGFTGFTKPAEFLVQYIDSTKTFYAYLVNDAIGVEIKQASVAYDPPSIPSGSTVQTTVTLNTAQVGNIAQAAFSRFDANIEISATVSAVNTVLVKFKNTGTTDVDLSSGTLTVKLI